jgi:hypothetical protein
MKLTIFAHGIDITTHCNMQGFEGVLTLVDVASDKAPYGSHGHRIILTREAVINALPSLLGMAISWKDHDRLAKCGIITETWIEENRVIVSGYIFKRDFPEIAEETESLGMSFELAQAHVEDMHASVYTLTKVEFTGASVSLLKDVAYKNTSFKLIGGE